MREVVQPPAADPPSEASTLSFGEKASTESTNDVTDDLGKDFCKIVKPSFYPDRVKTQSGFRIADCVAFNPERVNNL